LLIRMKNLVLPRCLYSPCGGDNYNYLGIDIPSFSHRVPIRLIKVVSFKNGEQKFETMWNLVQ